MMKLLNDKYSDSYIHPIVLSEPLIGVWVSAKTGLSLSTMEQSLELLLFVYPSNPRCGPRGARRGPHVSP